MIQDEETRAMKGCAVGLCIGACMWIVIGAGDLGVDLLDPPTPRCAICGAPHASWGIGFPARQKQEWFCREDYGRPRAFFTWPTTTTQDFCGEHSDWSA